MSTTDDVGTGRLLSVEEVADRLHVPVATVRWLRVEGRFAPAVLVGRRLRWLPQDVEAWMVANRESA